MLLNYQRVTAILLEEGCPRAMLPSLFDRIAHFSEETLAVFDEWVESRAIPAFEFSGITPAWLREHKDMSDIGIIIAYDWLQKEGDTAIYFLQKPVQ